MVTIPPIKMVMTGGWFIIVLPHSGLTWGVWFNPPEMDRYGDRDFSVNGIEKCRWIGLSKNRLEPRGFYHRM